jgi:hypothetical protein
VFADHVEYFGGEPACKAHVILLRRSLDGYVHGALVILIYRDRLFGPAVSA